MIRALLLAGSILAIAIASPGLAQGMQGMDHGSMPGMSMPRPTSAANRRAPATRPATPRQATARAATARPPAATRKPAAVRRIQRQNRAPEVSTASALAPVDGNDTGAVAPMSGMDQSTLPGMNMSEAPAASADPTCPPEHAKMGHCTPKAAASGGAPTVGTSLPAGNAPAPAPPSDHYADRIYPPAEMARARHDMHQDQGAQKFGYLMFNLAEVQPRRGRDAFRWDGEAWYGGDINRLTLKTEGEGRFGAKRFGGGVEAAEVQALYSRAIDPYFNLQAGIRQDLGKGLRRTYAAVGFEGLAPYWFEVEGALFLSDKGDVLGRLEGYYDQRITQRLVLQPRAEFNLAAQNVPANGIGAGLSSAELGLRLRYEIKREFAPYVGFSWERKVGASARYARVAGEDASSTGLVAGIRFWF